MDESQSTLESFTAFYQAVNDVSEAVKRIAVETRHSKSAHRGFDRCCKELAGHRVRVIYKSWQLLSMETIMQSDDKTRKIMERAVALLERFFEFRRAVVSSRRGVVAPTTLQQSPVS